jgi:hypothetical protein
MSKHNLTYPFERNVYEMIRKIFFIVTALAMLLLSACSAAPAASSGQTNTDTSASAGTPAAQDQAGQTRQFSPQDQPIEQKLAMGTLKLEGTDLAVTAEQAQALLPLWKAVKAFSASENVSTDEVNAVYTQIQEAMSEAQLASIKELSISPEEMQALMKELGVEMPSGAPGGSGGRQDLTEEQIATLQANRAALQAQGGTNQQGGDRQGMRIQGGGAMPGGGFPPDGVGAPNAQGTPQPGQMGPRGAGGGFNTLMVDPLIKLLQERAGS